VIKATAIALVLIASLVAPPAARAQPLICIAEGSPANIIAERLVAAAQAGPQAASVLDRWTRTATDGSDIVRGEPITLTWSILPDGTPIDSVPEVGDSGDPSDLEAYLDAAYGGSAAWLNIIETALTRWSAGPGVTFVYEPNDDGTKLGSQRGVLGVRGDIRIGGHDIDGNTNIVAYAFFPNNGDIVVDTNDIFNTVALQLRNAVSHEAGHSIGLGHTCPIDNTKLMEPFISTNFTGPQFDDLLGAHRNYGDVEEENDRIDEAVDAGFAIDTVTLLDDVALDGNDDEDFYLLPGGSVSEVTINLDPAGTEYDFYPLVEPFTSCSDPSPPTFDPALVQNLEIDVFDSDGTTALGAVDATGLGGSESLDKVRISKFGGYLHISGVGSSDAQRYDLEVTVVPEPSRNLLNGSALLVVLAFAMRRGHLLRARSAG